MVARTDDMPEGYSLMSTAGWFMAGGAVTAVFSGSLAALTTEADLAEVLGVGMVVPCFTWVVQLAVSAIVMTRTQRHLYWGDLGRVCLLGSVALLPAAITNLGIAQPPRWLSVLNVLASVVIMAAALFRRSALHRTSLAWPASWCVTIAINVLLFLGASWRWWIPAS